MRFHEWKACRGRLVGLNMGYYCGNNGWVGVLFCYLSFFYSCAGVKNVLIKSIVLFLLSFHQ